MKTRWKNLLVVGIFLLVLTSIWVLILHSQSANEADAYKRQLRARGEKLEINEVLPPSISAGQNGVDSLRLAFEAYAGDGEEWSNLPVAMQMIAPGKAMVGSIQSDVHDLNSDFTNTWSNILNAVALDAPARNFLNQAAEYPILDFQLDYTKRRDLLSLPSLLFREAAVKLGAAAVCDLHYNDASAAVTNLMVLLTLIRSSHDEQILTMQWQRMAMAIIAVSASWELLQSTNLTDAELSALETSWQRVEFVKSVENAFLMERAMNLATIKRMRASNTEFSQVTGMLSSSSSSGSGSWLQDLKDSAQQVVRNTKRVGATAMWGISWTYSDELQLLKNDEEVLGTLRFAETNYYFQPAYRSMVQHLYSTSSHVGAIDATLDDMFFRSGEPSLRNMFSGYSRLVSLTRRTMVIEAVKHIVITAIALKRFQLKHGNFPAQLSELTPDFMPFILLDPVDGKPLRYRRNKDGTFLLYSVGEDGVDNGGDPTMPARYKYFASYWVDAPTLDWVWPQPATAAEIEAFYAHPPK